MGRGASAYGDISAINTAGIGLRTPHFDELLDEGLINPPPWLELLADNWLSSGGVTANILSRFVERYPLAVHGVGLSIGSVEPLDFDYLQRVKSLLSRSKAMSYSEHLSFSNTALGFVPDLLPLPYSEEALNHVIERVSQVQDFLGRRMLIENVSAYIATDDAMSEAEFTIELARRSGCGLLVDVNNYYVNQQNLGRDAATALAAIPVELIAEIHLGGYEAKADYLLDAHNHPVAEPVWQLYQSLLQRTGPVATLIEWDNDVPDLSVLMAQRERAATVIAGSAAESAA